MPIYEYRCDKGHTFEILGRMADDPATECEVCGAPVERVFHPIAVHFKGSGFYTTDYGQKKSSGEDGAGGKKTGEKGTAEKAGSADKASNGSASSKDSGSAGTKAKASSGD